MILFTIFFLLLFHYVVFIGNIIRGLKIVTAGGGRKFDNDYYVTIIIPFRNEAEVLLNNYKAIKSLSYPPEKLEVIYIDDNSTDGSYDLLCGSISGGNIKVLKSSSGKMNAGKKKLIEQAVEKAEGDLIFLTDADCLPPQGWLITMLKYFNENTAMVSGMVSFAESRNFWEKFASLEFAGLMLCGAGLIGVNNPKLCSSANLAFRKEVFQKIGGYSGNNNLASGDDEFLMQKIASSKKYEIDFCFDKNAMVITEPNKGLKNFIEQRSRWASKGFYYDDKLFVLNLLLIFLFYFSLPLQLLLGLLDQIFWGVFLISILMKTLIEYGVLKFGKGILFESKTLNILPVAGLIQIPYIIAASIKGTFGGFTWKGRYVKR